MSVFIGSTTTAQRNCLSKEFKKLYAKKTFIPRKQKIAIALNTCNVGIKGVKSEKYKEFPVVFVDGKATIRDGRKVVATIIDREAFFKKNKINSTYSKKYPFSLNMNAGMRECETLEECLYYVDKYK
jgi:hypothetical protein